MEFLMRFLDEVPLMGIFISFAAFFLGIKFPDWDFKMKLKHRSILTHSPLILLIFIRVYEQDRSDNFRYFLMGFSLALALHFIYDLYPRGWGGGALIKIPILKISCTPKMSKMILFFSIVISIFSSYLLYREIDGILLFRNFRYINHTKRYRKRGKVI